MTPQTSWIRVDSDAPDASPWVPDVGVVLARASGRAIDTAGSAILAMAREWRDGGRRVFLCDACFESPFLHDAADLTNAEGLSDALLFGTSFQRIAHKLDRDLHLATAGTVVPDPAAARAHPRWTTILNGFAQAEALLVVIVPEIPAAGSPLDVAEAVCLDFGLDAAVDDGAVISIAALAPDSGDDDSESWTAANEMPFEPEIPEGSGAGADADSDVVTGMNSEAGEALRGGGLDPVPSRQVIEGVSRSPQGKSSTSSTARTLLLLLLLIVVGVLAAAWYGFLEIPGITPTDADAGLPGAVVAVDGSDAPATPVAQPIVPVAPTLGWVLALGAFRDREVALQQAERLRATTPGQQVLIIPVDADGGIFHRVAAGPVEDSVEAEALRTELDRPWGLAPVDEWVVRQARLAFQLGETGDLASAERRAEVLEGLGISTHLLAVPLSDGSTRFRVYAGAFASEGEAAGLRSMLAERGMANPDLVERIGRRPE